MLRPQTVALLLVCVLVAWGAAPATAKGSRLQVGMPAPALSGVDLTGTPLDLSAYRGKWVYVDFWATWCNPCMQELPGVVALHQAMQNRPDFSVLSVSLDQGGNRDAVANTAAQQGVAYPVLYDGESFNGSAVREWGVNAIPATFLINPEGILVARDLPPAHVASILSEQAMPQYTTLKMDISEQVLPDSPSTGRSRYRDLRIDVALDSERRNIRQYRLYTEAVRPGADGKPQPVSAKYEIFLAPEQSSSRIVAEIRKIQNVSYLTDVFQLPDETTARPSFAPSDAIVELDARRDNLRFIVPLYADSQLVNYAVMYYDEKLAQFVSNGRVQLDLTQR